MQLYYSFKIYILVVVTIFITTSVANSSEEDANCQIAFNDDLDADKTRQVVQLCLGQFPLKRLNRTEMAQTSTEELVSIDKENENNCALKCINENLNVTTDDGTGRIDMGKLAEQYRNSNATRAYAMKLTALLDECSKRTERSLGLENSYDLGTQLCKYHVLTIQCYSSAYLASRPEINKLCLKND